LARLVRCHWSAWDDAERRGHVNAFGDRNKAAEDFVRQWEALLTRDTNATRRISRRQFKLNSLTSRPVRRRARRGSGTSAAGASLPVAIRRRSRRRSRAREAQEDPRSIDNKDLGLEADYSEKVWFLNQQFMKGRIIKTIEELQAAVQKLTAQQPVVKKRCRADEQGGRRRDQARR
jgi:hypothetical protein